MTRKIKFILLTILIISVIAFLEWKISTGDPNFYYGKDGGIFRTLESILLLGSIFFVVMAKTKRILFLLLGFFVSLISSTIVYLILGFCNIFENLIFHIISCLTFIILFFYFEKLIIKNATNTNMHS